MLTPPPERVANVFVRAYRAGLGRRWGEVLRRAQVAPSTWYRMERAISSPRLDTLESVERAVAEMIDEGQGAQPPNRAGIENGAGDGA